MNLTLLGLLPRIFSFGQKLIPLVQGKATRQDYDQIIDELHALIRDIPQLKGLLIIVDPLVRIVKAVIGELLNDPAKAQVLGLTPQDLIAGQAVTRLLGPLQDAMVLEMEDAKNAVTEDDVDKLLGDDQ